MSRDEAATAPLVSVVIIFYNADRYLQEAIESVFAQTCSKWELLLADDGSTDGSGEIAQRYASARPGRVRCLEHPEHQNRGMSATRNLGVGAARGEFIALLDADDVWLPHKLERQLEIMDAHPAAGMVCGASEYWWSWTGNPDDVQRDEVHPLGVAPDKLYQPPQLTLRLYPLGQGTAPCPCDWLLRRDAFERAGGFEEGYRGKLQMYEDQAFLAKLYLQSPVFVSGECLSRYRQHPESCMVSVSKAGQYDEVREYFLRWFKTYLHEHHIANPSVHKALDKALWPYLHPKLARAQARIKRVRDRARHSHRVRRAVRRCLSTPTRRWLQARFGTS